jgi:transcriptional regulator with XRE-family HTH domain
MSYLRRMTISFNYSAKLPYVPVWSLGDRLSKTRKESGMSMKDFSKFTSLTPRQIQYAEGGRGNVSDVVVTVYAAKTNVDYWWLKTGNAPQLDPDGPDGGASLLGLDSNQEPIGSFLAYQIRRLERGRGLKYLERAA